MIEHNAVHHIINGNTQHISTHLSLYIQKLFEAEARGVRSFSWSAKASEICKESCIHKIYWGFGEILGDLEIA
jgi:hypothetical protein